MKIQAHRGASKECPENTIAAFRRAIELGADGIELDVRKLRDGSLVVYHDEMLERCLKLKKSIYDMTGKMLRAYSAGLWFHEKFEGERVPFFGEVLDLVKDTQVLLNVEIKGGLFVKDVADDVVRLLGEYKMLDRCLISSFQHSILLDIKKKYPQVRIGALYRFGQHRRVGRSAERLKFDAIHPYFLGITRRSIDRCHQMGAEVNVYTPNTRRAFRRLSEKGADSVITNDVAMAREVFMG